MAQCCEVLFYNDKKAGDTVNFAVVTKEGVKIEDAVKIPCKWNHEFFSQKTNEFYRPLRCHQN